MAGRQPGIREAIKVLSSILATNCGIAKIPSESFRLAKFNRPEAVETFRQLLVHLTRLCENLNSCNGGIGKSQPLSESEMSLALLAVRKHLFSLGYLRQVFFTSRGGTSSRELLLATIWVLQNSSLFSQLVSYHIKMANERVVPLKGRHQVLMEEEEEADSTAGEIEAFTQEAKHWTDMERLQDGVQKLVWLKGKLYGNWRVVLSTQHAYQRMAHSLHQYTNLLSADRDKHLTVHELFLLRHPEQLQDYMKELEWHVAALQSLVEWTGHEEVFWRWGESILDLQDREEESTLELQVKSTLDIQSREGARQVEPESLNVEELSCDVQQLGKEIGGFLGRNAPHIDRIHHVWAMKSHGISVHDLKSEGSKLRTLECCWGGDQPVQPGARYQRSVEGLTPSDCAVHLPTPEQSRKERAWQVLPGQQERKETATQLLQASKAKLAQTQTALVHMEETMKELKLEVVLQLGKLEEKHLTGTVYRTVPQLEHLSKTHKQNHE